MKPKDEIRTEIERKFKKSHKLGNRIIWSAVFAAAFLIGVDWYRGIGAPIKTTVVERYVEAQNALSGLENARAHLQKHDSQYQQASSRPIPEETRIQTLDQLTAAVRLDVTEIEGTPRIKTYNEELAKSESSNSAFIVTYSAATLPLVFLGCLIDRRAKRKRKEELRALESYRD